MSARDGLRSSPAIIGATGVLGAAAVFGMRLGAITLAEAELHRAAALCAFGVALLLGLCLRALAMRPHPARSMGCALAALGVGASAVLFAIDGIPPIARALAPAHEQLSAKELSAAGVSLEALCTNGLPSVPYARKPQRVLLAGFGNGVDFACAVQRGASANQARPRIDVAEPRAEVRARAEAAGARDLARSARVQLEWHAASARVLDPSARYDLVVLPASTTARAWPAGLLPLAEDTLQTDRGLGALLAMLAPKGELFAVVVGEPAALRFANSALLALRDAGVARPGLHVVVHRSGDSYGIGVRVAPYELDEMLELHRRAHAEVTENPATAADTLLDGAERFPELTYAPGSTFQNRIGELFGKANLTHGSLTRRYVFDIAPVHDARPLPAQWDRRDRPEAWSSQSSYRLLPLYTLIAIVFALAVWAGARARFGRAALGARVSLVFAALGLAQAMGYAWLQHELALWLARPLLAFALNALVLLGGAGVGLALGAGVVGASRQALRRALGVALLVLALIALALDRALALASNLGAVAAACLAIVVLAALGFALALPIAVAVARATQHDPPKAPPCLISHALAIAVAVPLSATLVLYSSYTAVVIASVGALTLAMVAATRRDT